MRLGKGGSSMFSEIQTALAHGEPVALVTVVRTHGAAPCGPGAKLLVRADGMLTGTLGGATTDARIRADALQALESGEPAMLTYHLDPDSGESVGSCGATLEVFVEPLRPEPRLLVAGSGYVAQALARLAVPLGWRVTLLDDRTEFVRSATLPEGVETLIGEMAEHLEERRPDPMTAVVIVTRGHRADQEVLRAALSTAAGYVGMIGSVSKVRAIFRNLLRDGVSSETLARVHAPIGLDLRAETPDEIALSIAAELLLWRRGGTGLPLKESAGVLDQVIAGMEKSDRAGAEPAPEEDAAKVN
jgi:xanthine dehydrogenase accessory factor